MYTLGSRPPHLCSHSSVEPLASLVEVAYISSSVTSASIGPRCNIFSLRRVVVREPMNSVALLVRDLSISEILSRLMQIHESLNFQTSSLKHLKERLGDLETTVARITPVPVTGTASPFPLG